MASQKRDAKWLKERLSRVLDWDDLIVEGLLDAVMRAAQGGDRSEVEEMMQNFMADSPEGVALINDFLAPPQQPTQTQARAHHPQQQQQQHRQQQHQKQPSAVAASAATTRVGGGGGGGGGYSAGGGGGGGGPGGGRSYASASSAASGPSAGASGGAPRQAAAQPHSAALFHQQQQQRPQQQQQQSQSHQSRGAQRQQPQAPAGGSGGVGSTSSGWQVLRPSGGDGGGGGGGGGAGGGTASLPDGEADKGDDDFARFVVDDRFAAGAGKGVVRGKAGAGRDPQSGVEAAGGESAASSAANGKVLGMFKQGGRIKAPAAGKPVGLRSPDGGALAVAASLERQVVNCLGCGKIYDCHAVTNDVLRFLDRGGICTFCGDNVPLTYKDRQKAAAAAAATSEAATTAAAAGPTADGGGGGGRHQSGVSTTGSGAAVEDAATVAARAFKDRLVEYDRNAAKRTTVIDDQSDYFEIDTNAWLTDQERDELRRRRQLEEEAEAARKKRLTVTIDLIGRKVVLDEDVRRAEVAAAAVAADRAAAVAKAATAAAALRNTDGEVSTSGGSAAVSGNGLAAMPSTGPTSEQLAAALEALRHMKASLNPAVAATAAPLFLPTAAAAATGSSGGVGGKFTSGRGAGAGKSLSAAPSAAGAGSGGGGGGAAPWSRRHGAGTGATKGGSSRTTGPAPRCHERVQHDLGAEFGFDAFGIEVALDELLAGVGGAEDKVCGA